MHTPILTQANIFDQHKLIPVVAINDTQNAIALAHALLEGGINIMEITLRTPNALDIINIISSIIPEMLVGAGTILTEDQYHLAIKHGAKFLVSPGLSSTLKIVATEYDIPLIPGAITPTEIMQALEDGFDHLKFFPAESFNGINTLKSLHAIFPKVKFCPTGGISLNNLEQYIKLPNVAALGCSFLANSELINQGDFAQITTIAKQALAIVRKSHE